MDLKNDPFLTHTTKTAQQSKWSQPAKSGPLGPTAGQYPNKAANNDDYPKMRKLYVYPMLHFLVTSLSFMVLWEVNKTIPILLAAVNLITTISDNVVKDSQGNEEDTGFMLPQLAGKNLHRHILVWLHIVLTWLAIFLGAVTGINAEESYMSQFYAITFFSEYENVLANTPGAAYSDAGKVWFASSSKLHPEKSVGFKDKLTYCAAPIIDDNQGPKSITFWAIGFDCCDARGGFKCGDVKSVKGGVRAPPDGFFAQDNGDFQKAVALAAHVNNLEVDKDVILLHWVDNPDHEAMTKFWNAVGAVMIGTGCYFLLLLIMNLVGQQWEYSVLRGRSEA